MLTFGMLITWAGYAVGSWGYCLIKGYDITFREWVSPLNSYSYPSGGPKPIPKGQLLPGGSASATAAQSGGPVGGPSTGTPGAGMA